MASLYDVANRAGVSKTLVSRVINQQKGVSEKSKEKIMEAMRDLNYTPNALARSLVLQKTHTIGVVLDSLCEPYYFDLIQGIEHQINKFQYDVIFCSGRNRMETKNRCINFFSEGRTDGVIIYGSSLNDEALIAQLSKSNFPFVVVENEIGDLDINDIIVDNSFGSKLAVEHLIDCGCNKIIHVTGDLTIKAAIDRRNGYIKAMERKGYPVDPTMILEAMFTEESGQEVINSYLATHKELPDAFYFGSDKTAFGGMLALEDAGIRIPEDVMIVGFDDDKRLDPERMLKKLTTLSQPLYHMGTAAVDNLLNEINGKSTQKSKTVFYPELVIRETTLQKGKRII